MYHIFKLQPKKQKTVLNIALAGDVNKTRTCAYPFKIHHVETEMFILIFIVQLI